MVTARESRVDRASEIVFASPDMLGQALDEVVAELPTREDSTAASPPKPVVPQGKAITARPSSRVADQVRPASRLTGDRDWFSRTQQALCVGLMLSGAVLFYHCLPSSWRASTSPFGSPAASTASATPTAHSPDEQRLQTKRIDQVRVGDRVVGRNPIREQADLIEPDPATWRKISLYMTKESGLGLRIDLLRPLTWIEEHDAKPGGTIFIDLYEMGAVGDAEVTHVGPCPEIHSGDGTVVTGTFKHQADKNTNMVHLKLEGQIESTGVTENHSYWSADRQGFVDVGKLRIGELVDSAYGLKHVVSVTPIEHNGFLYNLETTEHVYRVGSLGTLVHNSCVDRAAAAAQRFGGEALETANHFRFPNRQAARRAASQIAGNMGRETRAIPLKDFNGLPSRMRKTHQIHGRQSADGLIGWRDDFLGHSRFGAGPHVNVWVDGIEFHLWY